MSFRWIFLCLFGIFASSPSQACVICFGNEYCGASGGYGYTRCTVTCGGGDCSCFPSGGLCQYAQLKNPFADHFAALACTDSNPVKTLVSWDDQASQLRLKTSYPMLASSTDQEIQLAATVKPSSNFGCRSRVAPNGDVETECASSENFAVKSERIKITVDRSTLLAIAEIEPNLAHAIYRFQRFTADSGIEPLAAEAVVGARTPQEVRSIINGEGFGSGNRNVQSVRFRVEFAAAADTRGSYVVRFTPADRLSVRGASLQLELAADGSHRVRSWQPE